MGGISRRRFLGMCGTGLLAAASGFGFAGGSPDAVAGSSDAGIPPADELLFEGPLVPLSLPPWKYGRDSSAPDSMLMFRGNPMRNFHGTGPLDDAPTVRWTYEMGSFEAMLRGVSVTWAGTGWTGQPCRVGDWVFVGGVDRWLYALNAFTGRLGWRLRADRMFKSSPCIYENRLFIGNVDDKLRCVDAATGEVLWMVDTGADLDSSPCVFDNRLYIAGENGFLRCLDPATGGQIWKTLVGGISPGTLPGSNGSETSPSVCDGLVYTATYDGLLYCVDAGDGHVVWKVPTGDDTDASPVVCGDHVFIAAEDKASYLYCFDRLKGRRLWRYSGNRGGYWSTPAVVEGRVYIGGVDGVHCVDAKTGRRIWAARTGGPVWSSPCPVDGRVVFGSYDGNLYMVDAKTGAQTWKYDLGGRCISTPCIVGGRIYVGTATGKFFCFA